MADELLFEAHEWAELREGFGLSRDIIPARWLPIEQLYAAELRWQLYRELPLWAADFDLGERSNRCIFFGVADDGSIFAVFCPTFPH